MADKKLTKDELNSLRNSVKEFNQAKVRLADTVVQHDMMLGVVKQFKQKFIDQEDKLLGKYGKDARINLETGIVTKQEK